MWVEASPSRRGGWRAPALAAAVTGLVVVVAAFALPRVGLPRDATVAVPQPPGEGSPGAAESTVTGRVDGGSLRGGGDPRGGGGLPTVELEDGTTIALHPLDGLPAQVHRDVVTGSSRASTLTSSWSTPLAGRPTRPVVVGSAVLVRTTAEVALLDPDDGAVRWRRPLSGSLAPRDRPLVVDDVVVLGVPGGVVAVETGAGRTVWETNFGSLDADGLPAPVAVSSGTVAVAVPGGGLVGLADADGSVRWRTGPGGGLRDVPAADSSRVYVLSGGDLVATDIATGTTAWRLRGTTAGGFTRVASAGSQLLAVAGERMLGIEPATGDVRWSRPGVPPAHGRLAVADPVAVLPQSTGAATTLVAYRLEDGAPYSPLSLPSPTGVESLGPRLLVTSQRRAVRVVDPGTWSVVAEAKVEDPVVAGQAHGDRLVLVTLDGQATRVRGFEPVP